MPIYEYNCDRCGQLFELLVRPSSPPRMACPECGSERIERVISAFTVSSETTRNVSRKSAQKKARAVRLDQQVERTKYEHKVLSEDG